MREFYAYIYGAKGNWDFQISYLVKTLMELILISVVNFGEVRRAQLAKSTLHVCAPGIF